MASARRRPCCRAGSEVESRLGGQHCGRARRHRWPEPGPPSRASVTLLCHWHLDGRGWTGHRSPRLSVVWGCDGRRRARLNPRNLLTTLATVATRNAKQSGHHSAAEVANRALFPRKGQHQRGQQKGNYDEQALIWRCLLSAGSQLSRACSTSSAPGPFMLSAGSLCARCRRPRHSEQFVTTVLDRWPPTSQKRRDFVRTHDGLAGRAGCAAIQRPGSIR